MRAITTSACLIAVIALPLAGAGCSQEAAKRTSFETLQNLREQQCNRDLSGHCPPRQDYEAYRRKRGEALDKHPEAAP